MSALSSSSSPYLQWKPGAPTAEVVVGGAGGSGAASTAFGWWMLGLVRLSLCRFLKQAEASALPTVYTWNIFEQQLCGPWIPEAHSSCWILVLSLAGMPRPRNPAFTVRGLSPSIGAPWTVDNPLRQLRLDFASKCCSRTSWRLPGCQGRKQLGSWCPCELMPLWWVDATTPLHPTQFPPPRSPPIVFSNGEFTEWLGLGICVCAF